MKLKKNETPDEIQFSSSPPLLIKVNYEWIIKELIIRLPNKSSYIHVIQELRKMDQEQCNEKD